MALPVLSFGTLSQEHQLQPLPPFAHHSAAVPDQADSSAPSFAHVARAVLKAKRIAIVCGAGISCASGIPDFRSADGLFENLKKQHPTAKLNSGKDLFDASLFSSETNSAIFYTMIAELKTMADEATPTAFHRFLKALDDEGKLFRVYTQNIDGLEEKAGLSYGLGNRAEPIPAPRSRKVLPPPVVPVASTSLPPTTRTRSNSPSTPPSSTSSPPPTPGLPDASGIPRCIPLHGHLSTLSCPACSHSLPITPHLALLSSGSTLACPSCVEIDTTRRTLGDRSRGVGRMKPDVVLYGEAHPEGERVGEITRRDLMGPRPDLLLVVGTSLKVPGTKLLVRELAKVIRPPPKEDDDDDDDELEMPVSSGASTASGQRRRKRKPKAVHAVYLNLEFPTPSREFKDVFDVWMRGDVQGFVEAVELERKAEYALAEKRRQEREVREHRKTLKGPADSSRPTRQAAATKRTSPNTATATKSKPLKRRTYSVTSAMFAKKPKTKSPAGAGAAREAQIKAVAHITPLVRTLSTTRSITYTPPTDAPLLDRSASPVQTILSKRRSTRSPPADASPPPLPGPFLGFTSSKPGLTTGCK